MHTDKCIYIYDCIVTINITCITINYANICFFFYFPASLSESIKNPFKHVRKYDSKKRKHADSNPDVSQCIQDSKDRPRQVARLNNEKL